ncbi:uncharacterized protein [Eurosta solidaginis]|uniref:uncharacterized protein n=1 Tax=Eurosta solidaginis TaxID=178769 RepID=UPI003530B980
MLRFTYALLTVLVAVNAVPYGSYNSHHGYGVPAATYSHPVIHEKPSVLYHIDAPAHWNYAPSTQYGPALLPVDAHHISGYSKPSPLIGSSTHPKAKAVAASANVPLHAGQYKLLVVPSYKVPNIVAPEPALHSAGYGAHSAGYAAHSSY